MKAFLQALLSSYVVSVAIAIQCNGTVEFDNSALISSQNDLDTRFAGCTSIDGWLYIAQTYAGSFVLNNITNISGGIGTYNHIDTNIALTSVEANGLVSLQELIIFSSPFLKNVSFPDLNSIGKLEVDLINDGALQFSSLTKASSITLQGPITSMDFSSLVSVDNTLSVSSNDTAMIPLDPNPNTNSSPPITINFPSLKNCSQLELIGNISSISIPLLSTTVPRPEASGGGITINTNGPSIDVTLPKLWNTTQLALTGTFGSFSFPTLLALQGFTLSSFYSGNYSLAPLETATILTLEGNLTAVGLSSMQKLQQLSIDSDKALDCTGPSKDWARIQNVTLITDPEQQLHTYAWKGFRCESTSSYRYASPSENKSKKLKIGLSVGVGVPVFISLVYFIYRRFAWKKSQEVKPPPYEHELDDRHEHGEAPPTYAPRAVSERAASVSEVSSLSDSERRISHDDTAVSLHEDLVGNGHGETNAGRH